MEQKGPDTFEISLRILGNEILGMRLSSESRARNWAAFGLITLIVLVAMVAQIAPILEEMRWMSVNPAP